MVAGYWLAEDEFELNQVFIANVSSAAGALWNNNEAGGPRRARERRSRTDVVSCEPAQN
jgi:hypothetical protein